MRQFRRLPRIKTRVDMIATFPAGIGVEVGVYRGDFSQKILDNSKVTKLWLVDPWAWTDTINKPMKHDKYPIIGDECHQFVKDRFAAYPFVETLRQPSITAASQFEDQSLAWAYIDGDHRYEAVLADIAAWLPKIMPDGKVSGHDWGWGSVRRAVLDFIAIHPQYHLLLTAGPNASWWFTV